MCILEIASTACLLSAGGRMLGDMPGAETRAERVWETPAARRSCVGWMSLKLCETIAKAGAKLLLWYPGGFCNLRVRCGCFYFPALSFHEQRPAGARTRVCDFSPSLWEGRVMKHEWELTAISRGIRNVWGGNLSSQGDSAQVWGVHMLVPFICSILLHLSLSSAVGGFLHSEDGSAGYSSTFGLCSYSHLPQVLLQVILGPFIIITLFFQTFLHLWISVKTPISYAVSNDVMAERSPPALLDSDLYSAPVLSNSKQDPNWESGSKLPINVRQPGCKSLQPWF